MPTDLERADRELSALLFEAGIRPDGACGLTFRLLVADRLDPAAVAQVLGITLVQVTQRASKVRRKLLTAADAHARAAAPDESDDDESDDPLTEHAAALLDALRNRQGDGGHEPALPPVALVSLSEARAIVAAGEARRALSGRKGTL